MRDICTEIVRAVKCMIFPKQLEVDFVVNQGGQRYYIQVAYDMTSEEKQTQEFNSLRNIPDSFKNIRLKNAKTTRIFG